MPRNNPKGIEERTESFRADISRFQLLFSLIGQHDSCTIARWLKSFMEEAWIDISIFKHTLSKRSSVLYWELLPRIF